MSKTLATPHSVHRAMAAACLGLLLVVGLPSRGDATTVVLDAYDATGAPLSYDAFIATLEAAGWRNDVTYTLANGALVAIQPLYQSGGRPAFDVAGSPVGLSLAWPTASTGYSTLFLDNGGAGFAAGVVNFTYRAALDYRAKLADALARRPAFVPTSAFVAVEQEADLLLATAASAASESERGALGQQALDALARAFEQLLYDYGLQRARSTSPETWWGVTVDRINNYEDVVASIADIVEGASDRAYVRIVFDEGVPATSYDAIVAEALSGGLVVVGQILDSSAMSRYSLSKWQARVAEYVDHFPAIAVWEIGNEVNGEWLGPDVEAKLEYAAAYVKAADPADRTLLTLYWQMGTAGDAANSMFQWIDDNVTAGLRNDVDVVGLSAWIGDAPLGLAHDEVFERIHALFPGKSVVMGELGYWSAGTSKYWWWRSQERPETTVRRALAQHMYLANLGFDYGLGGVFWWFYYGEMRERTPLWFDVNDAYRSVYDCVDADGDLACDFLDDCPTVANADQADTDGDGVGDPCDAICPGGAVLAPRKLKLRLRPGADDQLALQATFTSGTPLDPVGDGVNVVVSSAGTPLLATTIGGPGAPVAFTDSGGRFRYRDRFGLADGIVKADLKPDRHAPGAYSVSIVARRASLEGIVEPDLRTELDFATDCAETHASTIYCTWRRIDEDLRCE